MLLLRDRRIDGAALAPAVHGPAADSVDFLPLQVDFALSAGPLHGAWRQLAASWWRRTGAAEQQQLIMFI